MARRDLASHLDVAAADVDGERLMEHAQASASFVSGDSVLWYVSSSDDFYEHLAIYAGQDTSKALVTFDFIVSCP